MLDIFALLVLIILLLTFVVAFVALGMAPGRIARQRNHPQADAINICGWKRGKTTSFPGKRGNVPPDRTHPA